MMFLFQENSETTYELKRKVISSGVSSYGLSLCLYLALLAIFASRLLCIKLNGFLTVSLQQRSFI